MSNRGSVLNWSEPQCLLLGAPRTRKLTERDPWSPPPPPKASNPTPRLQVAVSASAGREWAPYVGAGPGGHTATMEPSSRRSMFSTRTTTPSISVSNGVRRCSIEHAVPSGGLLGSPYASTVAASTISSRTRRGSSGVASVCSAVVAVVQPAGFRSSPTGFATEELRGLHPSGSHRWACTVHRRA